MRLVIQKDGGLSTNFDIIDEREGGIDNSSLIETFFINHSDNNKGIVRGNLPLEYSFEISKSFKKITKGLGFWIDLRTSNRKQDFLYTSLGDNDVNVTNNSISLSIPQITPSPETQVHFNEDISQSFTLSFECWTTDRKPVDAKKRISNRPQFSFKYQFTIVFNSGASEDTKT